MKGSRKRWGLSRDLKLIKRGRVGGSSIHMKEKGERMSQIFSERRPPRVEHEGVDTDIKEETC